MFRRTYILIYGFYKKKLERSYIYDLSNKKNVNLFFFIIKHVHFVILEIKVFQSSKKLLVNLENLYMTDWRFSISNSKSSMKIKCMQWDTAWIPLKCAHYNLRNSNKIYSLYFRIDCNIFTHLNIINKWVKQNQGKGVINMQANAWSGSRRFRLYLLVTYHFSQ